VSCALIREQNLADHPPRRLDFFQYTLPGGLEHEAQAGSQGALILDVHQAVREDYRAVAT
jgi:hypothetical protein